MGSGLRFCGLGPGLASGAEAACHGDLPCGDVGAERSAGPGVTGFAAVRSLRPGIGSDWELADVEFGRSVGAGACRGEVSVEEPSFASDEVGRETVAGWVPLEVEGESVFTSSSPLSHGGGCASFCSLGTVSPLLLAGQWVLDGTVSPHVDTGRGTRRGCGVREIALVGWNPQIIVCSKGFPRIRRGAAVPTEPQGLDLGLLRAYRPFRHDVTVLRGRIEQHLSAHDGYLAFSGGKDSLVTLHLALQVDPNVPVAFFDSGAEYPETYSYISELADSWDVNLWVYPSDPPLLEALAQSGAWDMHASPVAGGTPLHDILISEPAARGHADHGCGELWGVRAHESAKGAGRWSLYYRALSDEVQRNCHGCCGTKHEQRQRHGGVIRRANATTAYGPLWNWSNDDVRSYIAYHSLPLNPVYRILTNLGVPEQKQRVSHIIDGSFLEQGRVTWIRRGWPSLFEELATILPRIREFT